jgi:deoxyribodipyrimidine photo-lyase
MGQTGQGSIGSHEAILCGTLAWAPTGPGQRGVSELAAGLVWLRRDLRLDDHAALSRALHECAKVWCVFVFDRDILEGLPRHDKRVSFIYEAVQAVDRALTERAQAAGLHGVRLLVQHGQARQVVCELAQALRVQAVYANHDDEPDALARDDHVRGALARAGVAWRTCKDHVIFERSEVLTQAGQPFSVFTPYKNAWLKQLRPAHMAPHAFGPAEQLAPVPEALAQSTACPALTDMGFDRVDLAAIHVRTGSTGAMALLDDFMPRLAQYAKARDYPAVKGPSYLSAHLRFGTVSIRELLRRAWPAHHGGEAGASTWVSELVWRDFYHQILHHHPRVAKQAFKPAYDRIQWAKGASAKTWFAAWCEGRTGYPLVDAAMHQLNQTGYMHNRLRMVVASFLCKDLGLDWRWGEAYFAAQLLDFDLAANNGGWQWASSSGCDAQPYFRIFNPVSQSQKFDPQGKFIRRYLPQLAALPDTAIHAPWLARPVDLAAAGVVLGTTYPLPLVDHAQARATTLQRYAVVKQALA